MIDLIAEVINFIELCYDSSYFVTLNLKLRFCIYVDVEILSLVGFEFGHLDASIVQSPISKKLSRAADICVEIWEK